MSGTGPAQYPCFRVVGTLGDLYSSPAFGLNVATKHITTVGKSKSEESFPRTDHIGGELKYFSTCILEGSAPRGRW